VLGQPHWGAPGLAPNVVQVIEFGFVFLGLIGSLLVGYSIAASEEEVEHPLRILWRSGLQSRSLWLAARLVDVTADGNARRDLRMNWTHARTVGAALRGRPRVELNGFIKRRPRSNTIFTRGRPRRAAPTVRSMGP
jgi:hypothetical protein